MSISITLFVTVMAVASAGVDNPDAAVSVIAGGRVSFVCQAVPCVVVFIAVVAFVRPGEEAQFEAIQSAHEVEGRRDFICINVPFLAKGTTVREAMALFAKEGITDSPIIDGKGAACAFLSLSDIMTQLVGHKMIAPDFSGWSTIGDNKTLAGRLSDIIDRNVMGIATENVVVGADDSFEHVCAQRAQRRFKKVPVVENGRLIGTINRNDIIQQCVKVHHDGAGAEGGMEACGLARGGATPRHARTQVRMVCRPDFPSRPVPRWIASISRS